MERDFHAFFLKLAVGQFLSTRSAWSATQNGGSVERTGRYFYPRAPHGARQACLLWKQDKIQISIHALRMERDQLDANHIPLRNDFYPRAPHGARQNMRYIPFAPVQYFYPRAPHGARPGLYGIQILSQQFLSTRSAWSATHSDRWRYCIFEISIHALRMERDV